LVSDESASLLAFVLGVAPRGREISCTLLVGADGTGSSVRSRLDIDIQRHRYHHPIAVLYGKQRTVPEKRTLDVHLTENRMLSLILEQGAVLKSGFR
jgi:2-polyprenyl-6-methoxyphenol hydroxylase-like FAD-dependent oxidoreductase